MKGGRNGKKMETQTQTQVNSYVELFKQIKEEVGDSQIAAQLVEQIGKDRRTAILRGFERVSSSKSSFAENGKGNDKDEQEATPKQLGYLRQLGMEIPENLSKKQASEMIDQALAGQ